MANFINVQTYKYNDSSDNFKEDDCIRINVNNVCYISAFSNQEGKYYKISLANGTTFIIDEFSKSCMDYK